MLAVLGKILRDKMFPNLSVNLKTLKRTDVKNWKLVGGLRGRLYFFDIGWISECFQKEGKVEVDNYNWSTSFENKDWIASEPYIFLEQSSNKEEIKSLE